MNPLQNYMSSLQTKKTASPFTYAPPKGSLFAMSPAQSKPAASPVPNSPSAVSPAKPTIAPATSTPTAPASPAKNAYVSSLGGNTGLSEAQVRSNLDAYNAKTGSNGNSTAGTQNGSTGAGSEPQTNPKDAFLKSYRDYLSQYSQAIKPTADEEAGAKKLADIQSKIDERKLYADQEYQNRLDKAGGLKSGAEQDAAMFARRENADLANLSVQQGGAARNLLALQGIRTGNTDALKAAAEANKPIQIGDKFYDPATGAEVGEKGGTSAAAAGFTLSPGEVRYDAQGNKIASGGEKPMTAAQEAASIKAQEAEKQAQQQATQSLGLINNLLSGDRYKAISGGTQTGSIPFFGDRAAVNEYDQLQGLLKLGIRGLLKGQGAVSDYEGKVLGQAASSLSRLTSETQMKEALQKARGVIKTNNGQVTSVTVTNPETGESLTSDLSGPEIYQLVVEGNEVTYN